MGWPAISQVNYCVPILQQELIIGPWRLWQECWRIDPAIEHNFTMHKVLLIADSFRSPNQLIGWKYLKDRIENIGLPPEDRYLARQQALKPGLDFFLLSITYIGVVDMSYQW